MALDKNSSPSWSPSRWYQYTGYTYPERDNPAPPPPPGPTFLGKMWEAVSSDFANPEPSLTLRTLILIAEELALFITFSLLEYPPFWLAYMLFLVVGHLYSQWAHGRSSCLLKAAISLYMIYLLGVFFINLLASPYDPRQALAILLAGLAVGHSFDVPRRRDLDYSLTVSLLLMSFSAVMATNMLFGWGLAAYGLILLLVLQWRSRSIAREGASAGGSTPQEVDSSNAATRRYTPWGSLLWQTTYLTLWLVALGAVAFALLPRFSGLTGFGLAHGLNLQLDINRSYNGDLMQPGQDQVSTGSGVTTPLDDDYINFNAVADLTHRGRLSQELVMRVRTNREGLYYRGLAFRHYDGWRWRLDRREPREIDSSSLLWTYPRMYRHRVRNWAERPPRWIDWSRAVTQIFYIERDLPNIIFGAYAPRSLRFPTGEMYVDADNGLRSPVLLEEGVIYTMRSVPVIYPGAYVWAKRYGFDDLESKPWERRAWQEARNSKIPEPAIKSKLLSDCRFRQREVFQLLRVPPSVTQRTRRLARLLTEGYKPPYLKVLALTHFLRSNYSYQTPPPPYPANAETVDHFLFEARVGHCEQFATSLAIMARIIGLPARYVTGYGPGHYNPFTSTYEVRASDAHAWTEVFFEDIGWVAFDPTVVNPHMGGALGYARPSPFIGNQIFKYLRDQIPASWGPALGRVMKFFIDYAPLVGGALVALLLVGLWWYLRQAKIPWRELQSSWKVARQAQVSFPKRCWALFQSWRTARQSEAPSPKPLSPAEQAYQLMLLYLRQLQVEPKTGQTARQFSCQVEPQSLRQAVQELTRSYELEHYGAQPRSPEEIEGSLAQVRLEVHRLAKEERS